MLNPYCTLSILSSGGGDKPDSKRSPFVFHHNCLFYPLAIQPTGYFKPHPKKQILLQSCQAIFFSPSTGHLLCTVFDCIGFYIIYLFNLLLQEKQPEL